MKSLTPNTVDILLASYNGEKYIADQIDSILAQTHQNIHIFVRDDCSTDNTKMIIQQKKEAHPNIISIIPSECQLGVIGNFSALLHYSKSSYVMFADQDDFWLPDKIEKTLNEMLSVESAEKESGLLPILVHTDLKVVDANLKVIHPSFWQFANLNPKNSMKLNRLLVQNVITGCTMMMNRPLISLCKRVPKEAMMHDWWFGMVAAALGKVSYVNAPTMLYRQHSSNQLGAQRATVMPIVKKIWDDPEQYLEKSSRLFDRQKQQAKTFLNIFKKELNSDQQRLVEDFCHLRQSSFFYKGYLILKNSFYKSDFKKNLWNFVSCHCLRSLVLLKRTFNR